MFEIYIRSGWLCDDPENTTAEDTTIGPFPTRKAAEVSAKRNGVGGDWCIRPVSGD